jgi:hypothetical protein
VFLDEHDLQPGAEWREGLSSELAQGAAMFAIVTDAYASRAWCREELRYFREPKREKKSGIWFLRPVYILDNLSGSSTRSMFEVGNAPAARWNPERAVDVVDDLIREMLFAEVNRVGAETVGKRSDLQRINWVPDTWTLLQVLRSQPRRGVRRIGYPGDGLPKIELDRLTRVFPQLSLVSFEEHRRLSGSRSALRNRRNPRTRSERPPVLLSVSNPSREDLARRGMRSCHLDDATIRIARALLFDDFDVMYGGRPRDGFTKGFQDDSGAVVVEARLINHLGWPYTRGLTAAQVADGFGVTRYVMVHWPGEEFAAVEDPLAAADAASHTRRAVVCGGLRDLDDRPVPKPAGLIALGGQLTGFAGFLPGVAEEIAVALERGVAVYVLGGFGGAAGQVASVISGKKSAALTLKSFMSDDKYQALLDAARRQERNQELESRLDWLMRQLQRKDLHNGLTRDQNKTLWSTANLGEARV